MAPVGGRDLEAGIREELHRPARAVGDVVVAAAEEDEVYRSSLAYLAVVRRRSTPGSATSWRRSAYSSTQPIPVTSETYGMSTELPHSSLMRTRSSSVVSSG